MKQISKVILEATIVILVSALAGCSKSDDGPEATITGLSINKSEVSVYPGKYFQYSVTASYSDNTEKVISNTQVSWTSSDPQVATISNSGVAKGLSKGTVTITASYSGVEAASQLTVIDQSVTTGVGGTFSSSNIYDMGHKLSYNSVMQQFDIDKDGNVYYWQVGSKPSYYETVVNKVARNTSGFSESIMGAMTLYYAGHPTGACVEDTADGVYLWTGEYSGKVTSSSSSYYKQYWNSQVIARVKFVSGASVYPWDPSMEFFYVGNTGDVNVSIDPDHDILALSFHLSQYTGATRRIRIYSLKAAEALPLEDVQLRSFVYGGDGAPDAAEITAQPIVKAHNLLKLTPVAEIGTNTSPVTASDICYYAWQGFDVYGKYIYFVEGTGSNTPGGSRAALTVYNYDGTLAEERTFVNIAQNSTDLTQFGITNSGYMESEGVKAWNGNLYLGFASKQTSDGRYRANAFKYNLLK